MIDGRLRRAGGGTFTTINPATEEPLGEAADADAADMDRAIAAARVAFDESDWSRDVPCGCTACGSCETRLTRRSKSLREITVAEVGAPVVLTQSAQLQGPVNDLAVATDTAEKYAWTTDLGVASPLGIKTKRTIVREPFGVVGAITPWNFPHQINFAKLGPALAAGNTVVLKPAPDTPWCAAEVGRVIAEKTDIPPGVVNIVTSSDHRLGAQLSEDPRVDLVSFTGSTATGRAVMAAASQTIKKVFLELGGKSAFIVLDDADLASACAVAAFTVATHAGQGCAITTRLVVPRERYDEAVSAAAGTMAHIPVGDPADPATICGPLISARQRDRVQSYLDLAVADGGSFACGGGRPADLRHRVFHRTDGDQRLDQRRAGRPRGDFRAGARGDCHDGDADALRIANDSPYGLSGTVFGNDPERVDRVVVAVAYRDDQRQRRRLVLR